MTAQRNKKLTDQKTAIERLIKSDDGQMFIQYLGQICLCNMGVPCKDAYEYAYNEGKRSVFLAILQMAEKDLCDFIYDMVKDDERIY